MTYQITWLTAVSEDLCEQEYDEDYRVTLTEARRKARCEAARSVGRWAVIRRGEFDDLGFFEVEHPWCEEY